MAARRAVQAKSLASNSNLASAQVHSKSRLKSTSMTNLVSSSSSNGQTATKATASGLNNSTANRMQRPASRNALDNIHKGMNAKFTHVQSKVLLQNIRPQQAGAAGAGAGAAQTSASSRIPSTTPTSSTLRHKTHFASNNAISTTTTTSGRLTTTRGATLSPAFGSASASNNTNNRIQQSDKSQLINKIKALQEQLERQEALRDELKQELEREKVDKSEQVQQVKLELQEKVLENERHSEEYHQKLLEAYELADQNRRAADSVLSESRQREDELRKKIDELEQQLGELREFVAMKEEMVGKMGELREQIKIERERYEDKTRQLGQMFDNEKISNSNSKSAPMCADQNSNYFSRAKPSLQSVESINRLDQQSMTFSMEQQQQQQQQQDQDYSGPLSRKKKQQQHNKSEHDIYGSKLSTRMQDGARSAWKKSRKFASSVITGGLGGLQACRRNGTASTPPSKRPHSHDHNHEHRMDTCSGLSINHNRLQDGHGASGALNCATASSETNLNAKLSSSYTSLSGHSHDSQRHYHNATQAFPAAVTRQPQLDHTEQQEAARTSVIEVGVTVGEYIQQPQQQAVSSGELSPARASLPSPALHVAANCSGQSADDQQRLKDNGSVTSSGNNNNNNSDSNSLIRVDANNKLTIVTKFNDSSSADCCHSARLLTSNSSNLANNQQQQQQQPSSSSGSSGSERSRCESSSSGRGTSASDSGSSASQNGDHLDQQEHQDAAKKTGQLQAPAVELAQEQQQQEQQEQQQQQQRQANFQGHKRKSSLFKASNVFSSGSNGSKGSQVSLNKTIKSLFSLASSSMLSANKPACKYSNCSIVGANSTTTTTTTTTDGGHDQQAVSRNRRQSSGEPVVATSIVRNHHSFDESAPQPFHTITLSSSSSSAATGQLGQFQKQQFAPPAMGSFKGAPMASSFSSKSSRRSVAVYDGDDNDNNNASDTQASEATNKVGGNDDEEAAAATVSVGVGELERAIMHKFAQDDGRTNFGQGATTVLVHRNLNSKAQTDSPKLNENNNDNDNTSDNNIKCCRQLSAIEAGH